MIRTVPGLADQVYQAILDEICEGTLAPGAHLVQEQLAERLGVSRQPVQQAMTLLKAEGMVEEIGRRGLRVAALDLAAMRHHYEIRAALDGLAARRAAERAKAAPEVSGQVAKRGRAVLAAGETAIEAGAIGEQIRHDEALHTLIYEFSGNPLLPRTAAPHWRFLRRAMGDVLRHAEPPREIWRQHAEIIEAVVAGDPDLAEECAVRHSLRAAGALSKALTAKASAGPDQAGQRSA